MSQRTQHRADVRSLDASSGISVTSDSPGGFAAFGLIYHPGDTGFFSSMNFFDPKMLRSSGSVFVGVPVGTTIALPQANYLPEVSLANFGSSDSIGAFK
jgi:hypothetical protein